MNPAGTQLSSLEADSAKPHPRVVRPDEGLASATGEGPEPDSADSAAAGQQLAEVAGAPVAMVAQPVAGELTLVPAPDPIPLPSFDLSTLAELFEDAEIGLTLALRLGLKRAMDVVLSLAALAVLAPVMLVVALVIKLGDGGPVFFAQRRIGLRGRTFRMLKFRSMVVHAERLRPNLQVCNESNGPVFKMRLDPRVTTIGRFIRRFSLDELPQLFNVLRGDMSIVGPRPCLPSEAARYEQWQCRRFAVRPGLTCLWQVDPARYQVSFDEWMKLDLKYVDEWNLRLDVALILRTFRVVFEGTGR
jgi:lipopolysaccharide/colanic/teichoic acid biosynthesis glycosyltransferase